MAGRALLAIMAGCAWATAVAVMKGKNIDARNENGVEVDVDSQSESSLVEAIGAAAALKRGTAMVSSQTDDSALEAEVLALQQRLSRQTSFEEVKRLGALSKQLQFTMQKKLDAMQDSLEGAWSSFVACSKKHEADAAIALQKVDAMASRHAACRVEEVQSKLDFNACEANVSISSKLLHRHGQAFDLVNEFPRKGFCMHTGDAREYITVREYLLHFRDYFKNQSLEWATSLHAHEEARAQSENATIKCYGGDGKKDGIGGQDQAYRDQRNACNLLQIDLENGACDRLRLHRSNCQACRESDGYFGPGGVREQAVAASTRAEAKSRRLAEIDCAVQAYSAGGKDRQPWSQLVQSCEKASAKPAFRQLSFPDEKAGGAVSPGCAWQPLQPGLATFAAKYYRDLLKDPMHWHQLSDELLVCKGHCCDEPLGPSYAEQPE